MLREHARTKHSESSELGEPGEQQAQDTMEAGGRGIKATHEGRSGSNRTSVILPVPRREIWRALFSTRPCPVREALARRRSDAKPKGQGQVLVRYSRN